VRIHLFHFLITPPRTDPIYLNAFFPLPDAPVGYSGNDSPLSPLRRDRLKLFTVCRGPAERRHLYPSLLFYIQESTYFFKIMFIFFSWLIRVTKGAYFLFLPSQESFYSCSDFFFFCPSLSENARALNFCLYRFLHWLRFSLRQVLFEAWLAAL